MKIIRKLLFPIAIVYYLVTYIRNFFYDKGIFKSHSFSLPIIAIGNLNVGGTGKTPHTEYLVSLLKDKYKVAVLSRGYRRKSSGFVLAKPNTFYEEIGDEPMQIYNRFNNKVIVAVCEDRKKGLENLINNSNAEVVVLDDAYQHRKVKAGLYVLLTAYNELFINDYILPFGNLRESSLGKNRAHMVIVTKCPTDISNDEQMKITKKLNVNVPVYFSSISYDDYAYNDSEKIKISEIKNRDKLLVAGIANPEYFFKFLKQENDNVLAFKDHHNFTKKDIKKIQDLAKDKIIVTTQKDYVRLSPYLKSNKLFYLPITITFAYNKSLDDKILNYVEQNRRYS